MLPRPSSQPRIAIVGYTPVGRLELATAFREQEYAVELHETPELAALALDQHYPDVVILDWTVASPLTSLQFVERYGGLVPVVIFSHRNVLFDIVGALRAGAADYIRESAYFPEILARVEKARTTAPASQRVAVGNLVLDVESGVARIDQEPVRMTPREARMLAAMIRCPERAVSREALMRVAGITAAKATIVESYMKQLRKRHPLLRDSIRTRYGQGYSFSPER